MVDPELGLALVFNGAIYNYRELRQELAAKGYRFFSEGDTEVILKAWHAWGEGCCERLHGMFAFGLWDMNRRVLFLARDRFGVKPLHWTRDHRRLRFASSTQALLAAGGVDTAIDPVALHHLFGLHAVVPAPRTILNGVRKLAPAHWLRIEADGLQPATFADPADIHVGDAVVSVGYALDLDGDPTVAVGIVSALNRASSDATKALKGLIQTDAAISSGNSGGPLVNALGQVVGITTFIALDQPGVSANGVGFAISNAEVLPQIEQLRAAAVTQGSQPSEAFLGVALADRLDGGTGALVQEVVPASAAAEAGLQVGDIVLSVDDEAVTGRAGLIATIRDHAPGDRVTLSVRRDDDVISLDVTLGARPTE